MRSAILGAGLLTGAALADGRDPAPVGDWQLGLQARHALLDEAPFDKLNLGVTIRDGVAYLSGPVPSTAVAAQAVTKLRAVPGIRGVQDETFVPPGDEPLAQSMPHPVTTRRPSVSVAPAATAPETVASPMVAVTPPREPATSLGPPVAVPVRRMSIADQAEALRLGERRFQNVRIEVRGNIVTLRGKVTR
ncbi:MAG TPA: BON domain-containing protein, partial [Gemmataceae bacterium]|nr:BON domain-containing protein [Gemmataceae bacterium]